MSRKLSIGIVAGVVLALALSASAAPLPNIAGGDDPAPRINGARIVGTTPGKPFLFLVPATGQGPLQFSAENLPAGLTIDSATGIVTGSLAEGGTYVARIVVTGPKGEARRNLVIVGGARQLALTPPMGWNSWNVWGLAVDDGKVRAAADAMVKSGLAAHGFQFINIDDGWEEGRDADGNIKTNKKFPDMPALSAYVHSLGLKLGIYSSPGPKTCGGYEGSWGHEAQDAATYAAWGIDYLKYDWCSYTGKVKSLKVTAELQKPYILMRGELDKAPRDIVFSLCQYGMGSVWEWGANPNIGGNLWRTTGDIRDTWGSMSGIGFGQNGHEAFAGPGHWNDPDMLVVGSVGWGPTLHPSRLTPDEQITHITLWSLLAAPLLIGCDMANMDRFTLDLLTNAEVLDVNQDPLGKAASRKAKTWFGEVWARPLWDGTLAVGLFNRSPLEREIVAKWSDLGLRGSQPVRCLWRHQDLAAADGSFSAKVPAHGALLLKIGKPASDDYAPGK
jgi:alpha-galactosidase